MVAKCCLTLHDQVQFPLISSIRSKTTEPGGKNQRVHADDILSLLWCIRLEAFFYYYYTAQQRADLETSSDRPLSTVFGSSCNSGDACRSFFVLLSLR